MEAFLDGLGAWAPLVVFLLSVGESAAFLGLFLPGEATVVLGGVLAGTGRASFGTVALAAVAGAVIGDSIGYWMGARFGSRLLAHPRLESFARRLDSAEASLATHGWWALVIARFSSFFRAVVPFAAGTSRMPYGRFLVGNVIGGVAWGLLYTRLGYLAGDNYPTVERWIHTGGLVLAAIVTVIIGVVLFARWVSRNRDRIVRRLQPLLDSRPITAFVDLVRRPGWIRSLLLLWPAGLLLVAALWVFAGVLQDLLHVEEFVLFDAPVLAYVQGHEIPELVTAARFVVALVSPLVLFAGTMLVTVVWSLRHRTWRPFAGGLLAMAGQWGLVELTQLLVDRTPPDATPFIERTDYGFPSLALSALAAALVVLVWPWFSRSWGTTSLLVGVGGVALVLVGSARLVLLVEYPSDILAGAALGTAWGVIAAAFVTIRSDASSRGALRSTDSTSPPHPPAPDGPR